MPSEFDKIISREKFGQETSWHSVLIEQFPGLNPESPVAIEAAKLFDAKSEQLGELHNASLLEEENPYKNHSINIMRTGYTRVITLATEESWAAIIDLHKSIHDGLAASDTEESETDYEEVINGACQTVIRKIEANSDLPAAIKNQAHGVALEFRDLYLKNPDCVSVSDNE